MKVPWSRPCLGEEEKGLVQEVMQSGWISMGPKVKQFERSLEEFLGAKDVVAVNNGTSALLAAYLAAGVRAGHEVIAPTYTFVATINALLTLGARPILVDCDRNTLNISEQILEKAVKANPSAKAVVVVDVAGMPCDLDPIAELAEKHGLILIEDAAEAIGAVYRTKRIGSRNHLTVFSFHAAKLLTTIEGGAISTGDDEQAESLRGIRSHYEDRERKYWHVGLGLNMRPTELQAAIGLAQVHKVPAFIENRNKVARLYRDRLAPFLAPQEVPDYVGMHPYMFYAAFCGNNSEREHLVSHLTMKGVDYRMPWPPVHMQTFHRQFFSGQYPDAEQAFSRVISPPMCNDLTAEEVDYVIATIRDFFEETPR